MGIYLPNMEMPSDCVVCPFGWNSCNHQHDFVYMGERPPDCPLVPVPPHGALMDRDAFERLECNGCDGACEIVECDCINCDADCRCDFMLDIRDAPTIIEAEGET